MARRVYFGNSSSSRRVKGIYLGISGSTRRVVKGYVGANGSARQFYPLYKWKQYSVNSVSTLHRTVDGMTKYYVDSSGATNRYLPAYESSLRATPSGILVLGASWIDALYNFFV